MTLSGFTQDPRYTNKDNPSANDQYISVTSEQLEDLGYEANAKGLTEYLADIGIYDGLTATPVSAIMTVRGYSSEFDCDTPEDQLGQYKNEALRNARDLAKELCNPLCLVILADFTGNPISGPSGKCTITAIISFKCVLCDEDAEEVRNQ